MQYKAQVQESITILTNILESKQPADRLISFHFKNNRFIGSKDKAIISNMVYSILRNKASHDFYIRKGRLEHTARNYLITFLLTHESKDLSDMNNIFEGSTYSPARFLDSELKYIKDFGKFNKSQMTDGERLNFPEWLEDKLKETFTENFDDHLLALNKKAPVTIRVNSLKTTRKVVGTSLKEADINFRETTYANTGISITGKVNLFNTDAFRDGFFEVQDEGSQILAEIANAQPKQNILDMCCGAGGKLLAMAATMNNKGTIIGTDINARRLGETKKRLKRAGISNAELKPIASENDKYLKRQKERFDTVFVDAPCSGTGTWRRNPDSKWNLEETFVESLVKTQQSILQSASRLVKANGKLIYATCSVLKDENDKQITAFLEKNPNFELVDLSEDYSNLTSCKTIQLTPLEHGCDGFFVALLTKKDLKND